MELNPPIPRAEVSFDAIKEKGAMFDHFLTAEGRQLRDDVRALARWVPREMILEMDRDRLQFPKAFLREAGRRNLMGCRYPVEWGGRGLD